MKFTNKKLLESVLALRSIGNKELPIKISFILAKNISSIEKELEIYNTEREKLIQKYAVKDENNQIIVGPNNQIQIKEDSVSDWTKDIQELENIEIEIFIHKFNVDSILNSDLKITPAELVSINYMIEE
ncbi:hypothetical protein [Paraclostridium bifermentans]